MADLFVLVGASLHPHRSSSPSRFPILPNNGISDTIYIYHFGFVSISQCNQHKQLRSIPHNTSNNNNGITNSLSTSNLPSRSSSTRRRRSRRCIIRNKRLWRHRKRREMRFGRCGSEICSILCVKS
ncbi:hypothetical protein ACET3Z_002841 [Daucus carota]